MLQRWTMNNPHFNRNPDFATTLKKLASEVVSIKACKEEKLCQQKEAAQARRGEERRGSERQKVISQGCLVFSEGTDRSFSLNEKQQAFQSILCPSQEERTENRRFHLLMDRSEMMTTGSAAELPESVFLVEYELTFRLKS